MNETVINLEKQPNGDYIPAPSGSRYEGISPGGHSIPDSEPLVTPKIDYNEVPTPKLCSANICKNGHEWQPVIQLARCPGCGSPLLAVKMLQCPICNEPVLSFRLRSDHLPQGGAIMPMCRGSQSLAEVQVIEMTRSAAATEEANYVEREMISKP